MEWQPIETAPSGRFFDIKKIVGDKQVVERRFMREMCLVALNGRVYHTCKLENGRWNGFSERDKPTHWMPLPKPPEDK